MSRAASSIRHTAQRDANRPDADEKEAVPRLRSARARRRPSCARNLPRAVHLGQRDLREVWLRREGERGCLSRSELEKIPPEPRKRSSTSSLSRGPATSLNATVWRHAGDSRIGDRLVLVRAAAKAGPAWGAVRSASKALARAAHLSRGSSLGGRPGEVEGALKEPFSSLRSEDVRGSPRLLEFLLATGGLSRDDNVYLPT